MVTSDCPAQVESIRSLSEVVTKAIILRITTAFIIGHQTTLRHHHQRKTLQALEIFMFILFPTLPLAQLFLSLLSAISIRRTWGTEGGDWRFYCLVAMGMHTVLGDDIEAEDAETIPISQVQSQLLTPHDGQYLSWTWFGRLLVIICWMAQGVMTIILWIRRHQMDALWQLDNHNILVAIGALAGAVSCCMIHICNRTYTWEHPQHATYSRYQRSLIDNWRPTRLVGRVFGLLDLRNGLFWDLETALVINRLLLVVATHPYHEMAPVFSYSQEVSLLMVFRGVWMLVNFAFLVFICVPPAHMLITSLGLHGRIWTIIVQSLYLHRLSWTPHQAGFILLILFWGIGWEMSVLVGCPGTCDPGELRLMWKDPLENKLFIF